MDGRNVGGSNSSGAGRPKLVRSGISLQKENTPGLNIGSAPAQDVGQSEKQFAVGSLHKPQASALSFLGSKASAVDNISQNIASSSSVVSAERPKVFPATMSEGLSSLVSYSSSSNEASGSEDNGQDDQLNASSPAKSKSGIISNISSETLVKKIEAIASNNESQEIKHVTSTMPKEAIALPIQLSRSQESSLSKGALSLNRMGIIRQTGNVNVSVTSQAGQQSAVTSTTKTDMITTTATPKAGQQATFTSSVKSNFSVAPIARQQTAVTSTSKTEMMNISVTSKAGQQAAVTSTTKTEMVNTYAISKASSQMTVTPVVKTEVTKTSAIAEVSQQKTAASTDSVQSKEKKQIGLESVRTDSIHSLVKGTESKPVEQVLLEQRVTLTNKELLTEQSKMSVLPAKEKTVVDTSKKKISDVANVTSSNQSSTQSVLGHHTANLQQGNIYPVKESKPLGGEMQMASSFSTSEPLKQENSSQSKVTVTPCVLQSSEKLQETAQSSVIKETAQASSAVEMKQDKLPSTKKPETFEELNIPLDPIEEQLKLLTEGHPISDSEMPDLEGDSSLNITANDLLDNFSSESAQVDIHLNEMNIQREFGSAPVSVTQQQPQASIMVQNEKKDFDSTLIKKEESAQAVKEEVQKSSTEKAQVTGNSAVVSSGGMVSQNVSMINDDKAEISSMLGDQKTDSDAKSNKRPCGTLHEPVEPQEKKMKVSEDAVSQVPTLSHFAGQMNIQNAETEKMEVDDKSPSKEVLPTFEKLSEDFEAAKKISVEEDSKISIDDSSLASLPFKEKEEKDDDAEGEAEADEDADGDGDEAKTPMSRKKRNRKKAYERPRGEGGKFLKEKYALLLDEDTRMEGIHDEDSQGSTTKREVRRFRCEVIVPESTEVFTADKVVEYVWPLEGCGEHYFIQEQISQYLGIMSFKRKYPDLRRRPLEMQERDYLKDKGLVSEMACDLGLTAVRSEDVLDVMVSDFPSKFEELQRLLRERKEMEMKERGKVNYSMATLDKSKMQEYLVKAAEDSARWNAAFNREKREERRFSFDLQTCTLQMPSGRNKKLPPEYTKIGAYPVAVLPGQFTDYFREYTAGALKSMPLNTVMAAPITNDSLGSDGAGSDSEEDASVMAGTDVTDGTEIKEEKGEPLPHCKVCDGTKKKNKEGVPEPLIICSNCRSASHPTCIDLTLVMVPKIESYDWQCMDCKSCVTCSDPDDEDKMIFCDMCDRGYHIFCVGLRRVPNGRWHCKVCAICSSCGSKTPGGSENAKNAEWQHEFRKDKNDKQLRYATTLCVPCDKYWKRRQFCYVCLKVYRSIPEDGMVRCSNCPKYIHREGCSTIYEGTERFCNNCFKIRNSTALNHSRIIAAAKKKMASGY